MKLLLSRPSLWQKEVDGKNDSDIWGSTAYNPSHTTAKGNPEP